MEEKRGLIHYHTGFTCGAFNPLHGGHILMLDECVKNCQFLIVGLQSDPSIDRIDKAKPVQSVGERKLILESLHQIRQVVVYDTEQDLYDLLKCLQPDVRFIGEDWKGKEYTGHDLPGDIFWNSRDHDYSSTRLRQAIAKQETELLQSVAESAVKLLSPPYRRRNGTAPSYQSELRDWDKLAEDLVNAGYCWEEYT